jgi:hypothetical protein
VAAAVLARDLHCEVYRLFPAIPRQDFDRSAMHSYPVGVHLDAGLGHQDESAATHICPDLQCGLGDHRVSKVELHRPADCPDLHPCGDHPLAAARGVPALVVEPDNILGLRRDRVSLARHGRQVGGEHGQFAAGARRQRCLYPLVELGCRQSAVTGRHAQDLYGAIAVFMRGPQLRPRARTSASARGNLACHSPHFVTHRVSPQQQARWPRLRALRCR